MDKKDAVTKQDLQDMQNEILTVIKDLSESIAENFAKQGEQLAKHSKQLDQHDKILFRIERTLAEHDQEFVNISIT